MATQGELLDYANYSYESLVDLIVESKEIIEQLESEKEDLEYELTIAEDRINELEDQEG